MTPADMKLSTALLPIHFPIYMLNHQCKYCYTTMYFDRRFPRVLSAQHILDALTPDIWRGQYILALRVLNILNRQYIYIDLVWQPIHYSTTLSLSLYIYWCLTAPTCYSATIY
ncbi:unnamed protein product [Sphacelaria rigidula]